MANNYKVKMKDIQNKYKFKIFCAGYEYDDTEIRNEINQRALITEAGRYIELELNPNTYVLTAKLKDKNNNVISTSTPIDLPLESMIVDCDYDATTKSLIITLQNGNTTSIPLGDLIEGLATEEDLNEVKNELDKYKTIYNVLPKVEDEGEELTLDDTGDATLKMDLKGNTSQKTTAGINMLNIYMQRNAGDSSTNNGITFTINNDGSVTLNGTATAQATFYVFSDKSINFDSGNYTLYGFRDDNKIMTGLGINTDAGYKYMNSFENISAQSFTNPVLNYLVLRVNEGVTISNEKVYPMLVTGTYTKATFPEFEPYTNGASPNPSYPQDVNVVSGDNVVRVNNKNLASDRWDDFTQSPGTANYKLCPITLEQGKTYIIHSTLIGTKKTSYYNYGIVKDGDTYNTFVEPHFAVDYNTGNAQQYSFTVDSSYKNPKLICYAPSKSIFEELFTNYNIQLVEGDSPQPFEPYQRTDYNVNLGVENLFDKVSAVAGQWYYQLQEDGTIKISRNWGNDGRSFLSNITLDAGTYTLSYIPSLSGTEKVERFSIKNGTTNTDIVNTSVNITNGKKESYTFTLSATSIIQICIMANGVNGGTLTLDEIQLEAGTKANSYSEYGTTPIELCKIGDYQDYFYKDSGKWYLRKNVRHLRLNVSDMNNSDDYPGWKNVQQIKDDFPNQNNQLYNLTNYYMNISEYKLQACAINTNSTNKTFYLPKSGYNGLTQTQWMTNYPDLVLEMFYGILTPTTTEITDATLISQLNAIENALSYKGQTNISQVNNDLPFIIDASALKDLSNL